MLLLLFLPFVGLMSAFWAALVVVVFLLMQGPGWSGSTTVEEGGAYGVTIGTSKDLVYSDLIKSFSILDLYVEQPTIPDSPPDHRLIGEGVYEGLMKHDVWRIRPFNQRIESLEFTFKNSRLIKIHNSWAIVEGF
jgi:hypothetical protein